MPTRTSTRRARAPRASRAPARPTRRTSARAAAAFARLVDIMAALRSPRGCPWDVKQTHETLRPYLVEETYEALDAIDRGDFAALPGELGDVLFQCVFHAQIAAEAGRFDIADVAEAVANKLISRHPHVFTPAGRLLSPRAKARTAITSPGAVVDQWGKLKAREQTDSGKAARVLAGVPRALPALLRAYKIGSRVAAVGFDWPAAEAVVDKIDEEVRELRQALTTGRAESIDELGDVLFAIANLSRKLSIEPEMALRQANDKFTRRFNAVEARLDADGRRVHDTSLDELEAAWRAVKTAEAAAVPTTSGRSTSSGPPRARRSRR